MNVRSMKRGRSPRGRRWVWLLAVAASAVACSRQDGPSGGGGPDGGTPVVVRVEVTPGALLLGGPGQTHGLTAQAFDAQGTEVPTAFTWTSSRPAEVTVDSAGRVSAVGLGSAQVTAQAGGVTSPAVTVLVAETAPGAVLLSDAQVVSVGPVTSVPAEGPGPGMMYEVRLRGGSPAPAAGTILLASESAQVAGKVVSTRDESGTLVVTLELRPLYELLRRYHIDWDLDVASYAPEDLLARSAATEAAPAVQGDRSGALTRRSPAASLLRPFSAADCKFEFDAQLFKKTISLSPSSSLRWVVQETRDDPNQGPTSVYHALVGQLALQGSVEFGVNAEVSVSGSCKAQLPPIRIAAFGALSVLVMPAIRVGVGIDLSGGLHVANGALGITGKVGVQPEIGWKCGPPPAPCEGIAKLTEIKEVTPKFEVPSIHQMKVKLDAQVYALVGLDLAVLGGLGGYFGIAEAKIGPKQSASLGFEDDQAKEPDSSSYDLKLSGSIGPGPGLSAAIKEVIDDDTVSVNLSADFPVKKISESPKGTLAVDKENAAIGQNVKFTVDITPETASYAGIGYNVVAIQIWRKAPGEDTFKHEEELDIFPSASNQMRFEKTWKPKEQHVGKNEFAAFVHTEVHDTGLLPLLEVAADSRKQVDVQAICPSELRAASGLGGLLAQQQTGSCSVRGTLRHVAVTDGPATHVVSTSQASVTFAQDPDVSSPIVVVFRPEGTCSMEIDGTSAGCTISASSTSCTLQTDRSAVTITVDASTDPPTYHYIGLVGAEGMMHYNVVCPEATNSYDAPLIESLMSAPGDQGFIVDPDGHTLRNSYSLTLDPVVHTWTWDLTLDIPAPPQ